MKEQEKDAETGGNSYRLGHPWHYASGGPVAMPRQICERARASGYCGYRADEIAGADSLEEPRRSTELRAIREQERSALAKCLREYRRIVRDLHRYRRSHGSVARECHNVHQAAALKYNHLHNAFAHLIAVEALLAVQRDLFD